MPEVEPEGDDEELVEPGVPEALPLAVPEVLDADVSVLLGLVVPLAVEEVDDGLVVDGEVVELVDGVVAVVDAPVPVVEVLLAGRSQPAANAAANARAAVSGISFMSAPWFGGGKPLCTGASDAKENKQHNACQRRAPSRRARGYGMGRRNFPPARNLC